MSTRATYSITQPTWWGSNKSRTITFYIHHDGYPEGAADYFAKMLNADGASLIEKFIRGNDRAEITESHEIHGDTEYRYYLTALRDEDGSRKLQLKWFERKIGAGDKWEECKSVDLSEFINFYRSTEVAKKTGYAEAIPFICSDYRTLSQVEKDQEHELFEFSHWLFRGAVGNAFSIRGDKLLRNSKLLKEARDAKETIYSSGIEFDKSIYDRLSRFCFSDEFHKELEK